MTPKEYVDNQEFVGTEITVEKEAILAGRAGKLSKSRVVFTGEGFAERVERLDTILKGLEQEWDNAPFLNSNYTIEDYLEGRFTFVAKFITRRGGVVKHWAMTYQIDFIETKNGTVINSNGDIFHEELTESKADHVVLIPVIEFIQGHESGATPRLNVSVRIQPLNQERFSFITHPSYRSIINCGYQALPIISNWERVFPRSPRSAYQPHPRAIQGASKVANNITSQQAELNRDFIDDWIKGMALGMFRMRFEGKMWSIVRKPRQCGIELIDVLIGPYNL